MKIKSVAIENFRGYQQKAVVCFENLTSIVGRNDIGKSTIMEALDIFFHDGKGLIKLDKDDINKTGKKSGGKSSVSCPLKPSDSAPLKHSTMPP